MSVGNLSERAMLARLSIHYWHAVRTDKKVTNEVASQHAVSAARAGHYRKNAINKKAPAYTRVTAAARDLRSFHDFNTLPWGEGTRILMAQRFDTYSAGIRTKISALMDEAVPEFLREYPELRERAKRELNGLFSPDDYPENIAAKFGVDHGFIPFPAEQDFRVSLGDADLDAVRASITHQVEQSVTEAMRDPYQRLYERLANMTKILKTPEDERTRIDGRLVTGLQDVIDVLPDLNLTGDQKLTDLTAQAQKMLNSLGSDPDLLRTVQPIRESVTAQAEAIQDAMAGFFSK